ncbi:MAG: 2-C-methyl-D-erythritol 4-phosphate cytidylyltransferase [Rhodanobacter denitrificans]|uniref:2-C-methyl-D-erythritol 4-phosphate cytidylyltransferase n=1 Tax=Rhodanobacter denitrificans TaxID=666685 RepID=A0A2W5KR78_9GAMM|nr:MAG: 2-C-methyl-D-erythritol 4-phosphate cytidylyltransferase [Rhodanobacter denitrificans]
MSEPCWCVVVAAGRGLRFGGERPKQYAPIDGRPLLAWTLDRLAAHPRIAGLVVVLAAGDPYWPALDKPVGTPLLVATGGQTRADSVLAGLDALPAAVASEDFVLVHDAARPCVRAEDVDRLITLGVPAGGGLLAAPLRDTLKRADASQRVDATEPREARWRALTPQLFRRGALAAALSSARLDGVDVTDEAMAMERCGARPLLVEGADDNIKVTTPADRALAEFLLRRLAADATAS